MRINILVNGTNKASVTRRAIAKASEVKAVRDILDVMKEPTLKGNVRQLAKNLDNTL